ncbi:MAG: apolipoprotein A1/A4/E family protein [Desulfobacteraceae bacterium]|nr:apolipoprotein A1/A4/E family protein [Desulfobacteraceae bacterium]
MSQAEKNDQAPFNDEVPLYINRKASTFVVKEEGKILIKEGKKMNEPKETSSTLLSKESPMPDIAGKGQVMGNMAVPGDGAGNIDKIRDIIFGNQMHDYEKRFARLEERMFKEMTVSKSESKKSIDSLEKFINKEIELLKDRMTEEQNTRSESVRELSRQLKDITRSLEKKIDNLGEQFSENSSDLRQQLLEQSQVLRNDIRQKYEETSSAIERAAQELRSDKVDRSLLADFFTEMAMRITNDGV